MSTSNNPIIGFIERAYSLMVVVGNHLQSPFLVLIRVVFGYQLMQAGWGKLTNIDTPISYFTSLGIPFPVENAWLVAFTETFGGLFLLLGLLSRLTCIPLTINFIVAYITTEMDSLKDLLKFDTDKFVAAAPFVFLAVAVIVLKFGPGAYSIDYLIARLRKQEWKSSGI